jgi:hypothetical protein
MGNGSGAFVGGTDNNIAPGTDAFVGAGSGNIACDNNTSVVGGFNNNVTGNTTTQAEDAFIGGGSSNTISEAYSAIAGGESNTASASNAFIGAGSSNTIGSAAEWGTIGGGKYNDVAGLYATIPGGPSNTAAGTLSFAAGYRADASHPGSFVWSDYVAGSSVVKDAAADQFVVRASGGTYIFSSENLQAGVKLTAGSGSWGSLSDRNAKTDIAPLDDGAILAKVAALPISTWRYKTETGARHIGPMAQDFYAAFGVGEDDRHITSIDEDGVALAAVKALHGENEALLARSAGQDRRIAKLEAAVRELLAAAKSR